MPEYAEFQVTTNYSFLRGASHPEELFAKAAAYGIAALGIVDRNSVAGMVRAWEASRETGVRLVAGCRLDLADGAAVLAYPADTGGWSALCQLLTLGKKRAGKGGCTLSWDDLAAGGAGLMLMLAPDGLAEVAGQLAEMRRVAPGRAYLAGSYRRRPGDAVRMQRLAELGHAARVPLVARGVCCSMCRSGASYRMW